MSRPRASRTCSCTVSENLNTSPCLALVSYLEKQLARAVNLNPALGDDLNNREAGEPHEQTEAEAD